jgi:hypothetical protein
MQAQLFFEGMKYVSNPLLIIRLPLGTLIIIKNALKMSTDELSAFKKARNITKPLNKLNKLRAIGTIRDSTMKGVTLINTNLDFDISSVVETNPPNSVMPQNVLLDFIKLGTKTMCNSSWIIRKIKNIGKYKSLIVNAKPSPSKKLLPKSKIQSLIGETKNIVSITFTVINGMDSTITANRFLGSFIFFQPLLKSASDKLLSVGGIFRRYNI